MNANLTAAPPRSIAPLVRFFVASPKWSAQSFITRRNKIGFLFLFTFSRSAKMSAPSPLREIGWPMKGFVVAAVGAAAR